MEEFAKESDELMQGIAAALRNIGLDDLRSKFQIQYAKEKEERKEYMKKLLEKVNEPSSILRTVRRY